MKKTLLALGCAAAMFGTSCIGPNNLFNSAINWTGKATDTKFVNELIFLGLNIIPVYPIFLWGDYVIFNSIEWWGGDNIITAPEPFQNQGDL